MSKEKKMFNWLDVDALAKLAAESLVSNYPLFLVTKDKIVYIYGVPRGGIYAAQAVAKQLTAMNFHCTLVVDPEQATVFVDDIIDTGKTQLQYKDKYPTVPFVALCEAERMNGWVVFPWEQMLKEEGIEDNVLRLLQFIGEDPERDGLRDTPKRIIRSYSELYSGYKKDPKDVITVFKDSSDEMVVLRDIEFYSMCEHHMLPFFGKAHIAYIPNGRVIGISKLARILEIYTRRLQIQERIGTQVTTTIDRFLAPHGAACVLEAQHLCMTSRGVGKQNSVMVTSSLTGAFLDDEKARSEFMSMIGF